MSLENIIDCSGKYSDVAVVVLNWRGVQDTLDCIGSLLGYINDGLVVFFVDNCSGDDSVALVRESFPCIRVIASDKNLGFSGGNNLAIKLALCEGFSFIWLLNNDTVVNDRTLPAMLNVANSNPNVGVVGSVIYHMDKPGVVQTWGGGWVDAITGRSSDYTQRVSDEELDYIIGASVLIKSEVFFRLGLLDDRFFMYFEDADFGLRVRRDGWRMMVAEGASVWHKGGASTSRFDGMNVVRYRSLLYFLGKHSPVLFVSLIANTLLRLIHFLVRGDLSSIRVMFREIFSFAARRRRGV